MKLSRFFILLFVLSNPFAGFSQTACDSFVVNAYPDDFLIWSPDSSKYLINKQDTAGIFQIYIGNAGDTTLTCISTSWPWSFTRPWAARNKLQVQWHKSGNYIICAVEKEWYPELLYVPYSLLLGWIQSGLWMDIMATTPDGLNWYTLANTEHGFTGPAFTPDGTRCVWSEAKDSSNLAVNVFGDWNLWLSDFAVVGGIPQFTHDTLITPVGCRWNEPGNFHPDGQRVLISADIGLINAEGQDQFILNVNTGSVTNLTNSPMIWDEHGIFSPDGSKILFMSSYPYQADTNSYHTLTIKTEFMLMNTDGSGLQQLTHLCDTGYLESGLGIAATGFFGHGDSTIYAQSLVFPDYNNWLIHFDGNCGYEMGVNETEQRSNELNLYPNPANSVLNIESGVELKNVTVRVFNAFGELMQTVNNVSGNRVILQTGSLINGIYVVEINSTGHHLSKLFLKN